MTGTARTHKRPNPDAAAGLVNRCCSPMTVSVLFFPEAWEGGRMF